jgi:hypothetical protein
MASQIEISNFALSHLGVGVSIASINEQSQEAAACRVFFEISRDATLRDFAWPFARRVAALALVEEDPTTEWRYSYRYPTDCLDIRRILTGSHNDPRDGRLPYELAQDDDGVLVYTDEEDAFIEYTYKADNPIRYPADFSLALSFRLASYIAPRLTGGDPFKLGARAMQLYEYEVGRAKANAVNEEQVDQDPESSFVRIRD